ncbi:flagellar hook-associated protein FlgK [Brevibacillus invocatus]|uniref:flagellar hook-associated protein FlgK n=1 Tax=Brevibacillus invocatus TaxID=173959 RepID=UPI00203C1E68|nr:flagellar hook-associated protein FlgK [Brevibacillus invocatus]MCM3079650.1 flagellar hook-associated protein FlgK [Brevibacillus invocatus]MCM3431140.1 flagellar hook-associated protein FlgK [Brevibacillus invocatus]
MRSTFHGLEVSKRGIFAQQTSLNTVSHNIANANTEGFTRQRTNMVATTGLPYPGLEASREPGILGTGVQISELQRLREGFLDLQFRNENKHLGYWEAKSNGLMKIETIMNEPSETGLQKVMDQFWQSWQDLTKEPDSQAARAVVRQRAIAIAESFSAAHTSMKELQSDLNDVIMAKVSEANSLAKQISNLNQQISDLVPHGYQPNDLYDQRDLLLDKLSKIVEVKVTNSTQGMINVTVDGQELVVGRASRTLATVQNTTTGLVDITLDGQLFTPQNGGLAGTLQTRGIAQVDANGSVTISGTIPDIQKRIDLLAANLTKQLNDLHRTGLNLDDIGLRSTSPSDIPFFVNSNSLSTDPNTKDYPTNAGNISINPEILKSLNKIAAAKPDPNATPPGSSYEGDPRMALEIAAIKFKIIQSGNGPTDLPETSTLDDFYRYTIAQLGIDSQEANRMEKNTTILVGTVDAQRQSVSGVSLDEEMADMLRYQKAYSAAARMMTAVDEVLDKIINGTGRVGL